MTTLLIALSILLLLCSAIPTICLLRKKSPKEQAYDDACQEEYLEEYLEEYRKRKAKKNYKSNHSWKKGNYRKF